MEQVAIRQWRDSDGDVFAAMNCDPAVMEFFPTLLTRGQSFAALRRQRALIDERGWGLWALDVDGTFAGFVGLAIPAFLAPFMPCVEIGWRLRPAFWGRSIAYRGARQVLDYGFATLKLPEIVSFTAVPNWRSRRLMERLGFVHDAAEDFDHPSLLEGHPLRRHVLYRLQAPPLTVANTA